MLIILMFDFFKTRRMLLKKCIFAVLAVVLSVGMMQGIIAMYEVRTERKFGQGMPLTSWLAMGLSTSKIENGWFNNDYSIILYNENQKDTVKTSSAAVEIIKDELAGFRSDLPGAVQFFYRKTISQWNDPSYQSLWINQVAPHYADLSPIGAYICGDGQFAAKEYMNALQQFIYLFALIGTVFCLKQKNQKLSIFALIVIGGFLYHFLFEAKSQYSLIYFILMFPLAAYGIEQLYSLIFKKIKLLRTGRSKLK